MIPAIGPSSDEQPTSQPKIYELKSRSDFHGIINIPTTPVISPPGLVSNHPQQREGRRLLSSTEVVT
jgi:hypothetical protein